MITAAASPSPPVPARPRTACRRGGLSRASPALRLGAPRISGAPLCPTPWALPRLREHPPTAA